MRTITGQKISQSDTFTSEGWRIPITVISVNPWPEEMLKVGDKVKIQGISKGKGFAGVVKRHGFKGGPRTHGQSDRERAPGSIGQTTTPGRVYKGKRMAGRMGGKKVTMKGLPIVEIKPEEKLIIVKGLIPGNKKGKVKIICQE